MNDTRLKKKIFILVLILCATAIQAQDTLYITDYGYKTGSRENAVPFVIKALADCKAKKNPVLIFPKGRYDFWPQYSPEKLYYESNTDVIPIRYCPKLIEGFKKLELNGMGSEFIYHGRIQPLTIDSSENVLIKNFTIDWDIPMTAQAEVMEVTDEYMELNIDVTESPYIIEDDKIVFTGEGWKSSMRRNGIMEFDKNTKLIPSETGDLSPLGDDYEMYKAKEIKYGVVRMYHHFKRKPAVGNFLILRHSARDHAGAFITGSKKISFENITFFQTAGLGILSQYSENLNYRNIQFIPNKKKNRYFSGHDDGFHFSNCKGQINLDSCVFAGLMDDPINVHGTSVKIIKKISGKKLLCKFVHEQSIGLNWARHNDKIGFIENDAMNTFGEALVDSFKLLTPTDFEISFKENMPANTEIGDALENLTWVPDVTIKNSFFGSNRARGILITTPGKVVIENNIFESSGAAILIAGDANNWYESGAVKDVLIQKNIFNDACMTSMYEFCEGIISIFPTIPKADPTKPFHRNIKIINNEFHPFDYPVLYAKSVNGIIFSDNKLIRSMRFKPFHIRKNMITLEACSNVKISNNNIDKNILGRDVKLISTKSSSVKIDKKQLITIVE